MANDNNSAWCRLVCPIVNFLVRAWDLLRDIIAVLKPTRFSVINLLIGLGFFIIAPQGQDVLRGLAEETPLASNAAVVFFIVLFYWGASIWYWARHMLRIKVAHSHEVPVHKERRFVVLHKYLPRLLGVLAFIIVAVAFYRAALGYPSEAHRSAQAAAALERIWWFGHISLILMVAFYLFVWWRRPANNLVFGLLQKIRKQPVGEKLMLDRHQLAYGATMDSLFSLRGVTRWLLLGSLAVTVALFIAYTVNPQLATVLGTASVLLLAAANWIPLGSALIIASDQVRLPIIGLLILLAILFSFVNDNHRMHMLDESRPEARPGVARHAGQWIAPRIREWKRQHGEDSRYPMFFVAAEGGGIRAAYWSASVLAAMQDHNPAFVDHVYALSGVSGGSLGNAVFSALIKADEGNADMPCSARASAERRLLSCAQGVLAEDFLSPTAAKALYPDLLQRFLFFPVPAFDRATALENSWEVSWRRHTGTDFFAEGFNRLWRLQGYGGALRKQPPLLFLNATWVETGRRVIASPLTLDDTFNNSVDLYKLVQRELPLSVAVHNSARFTFLSPAGTVVPDPDSGEVWGHLVDGGYFENSGATTLSEVMQAVENSAGPQWKDIQPVVLMITNDPNQNDCSKPDPQHALKELRSPLTALINTRSARGSYSRAALAARTHAAGGVFVYIGLQDIDGPAPLGWVLSQVAKDTMQQQLDAYMDRLEDPLAIDKLEQLAAQTARLQCRGNVYPQAGVE